ncbi:hypothetical protein [Pseudomonas mangiferae]|uniref:Uncharacterized protein n=1 Tax=Pseudomonas mangiferae TaxID=2593654 RepID=A0A553H2T8_9PSED|nr:hypothetical protein [Pseudomonas mangiferae]TRX76066.1 hypothetical protein FM069_02440 [Pseudomonas mangiferae]
MKHSVFYAALYSFSSLLLYTIIRLIGMDFEDADIATFIFGLVFALLWRPGVLAMVWSAALFCLVLSVDLHHGWYWISTDQTNESDWIFYLAGVGFVLPLLIVWLLQKSWQAGRYLVSVLVKRARPSFRR